MNTGICVHQSSECITIEILLCKGDPNKTKKNNWMYSSIQKHILSCENKLSVFGGVLESWNTKLFKDQSEWNNFEYFWNEMILKDSFSKSNYHYITLNDAKQSRNFQYMKISFIYWFWISNNYEDISISLRTPPTFSWNEYQLLICVRITPVGKKYFSWYLDTSFEASIQKVFDLLTHTDTYWHVLLYTNKLN